MDDPALNKYDSITLENTKTNKNCDKSQPFNPNKRKKNLGFRLDENVTYAFRKDQAVTSLLNPDHAVKAEIRKVLDEDSQCISVVKKPDQIDKPRKSALKKGILKIKTPQVS